MRIKRKDRTKSINGKMINRPSKEYTTEELIELGKKQNILKLARPLYKECTDGEEQEN